VSTPAAKPVGIIGAGRIGQAMARIALRTRRSVMIANSRGPESLTPLVSAPRFPGRADPDVRRPTLIDSL
jgi:lactate dehydrogenase-like 2-hydroxyacid dehydrogenase